jgi:hypothetical protein
MSPIFCDEVGGIAGKSMSVSFHRHVDAFEHIPGVIFVDPTVVVSGITFPADQICPKLHDVDKTGHQYSSTTIET